MLPTYVIGLREGLEGALIVGIIAAFLRQEGRADALRAMWTGVAIAVAVSVAVGAGLKLTANELPTRQQEAMETIIAFIAVGFVTFMIVWMRRNARSLKGELHGAAGTALAQGSTWALVFMAFFAVIREGFETAFFLTAAFDASTNARAAGGGAALGVLTAVALGYGIYRGGVKVNLQKFFRVTGIVLVFVAAGLMAKALHTGHEAGWFNFGQERAADLTWLVQPGTVSAAMLTGMLGLQPQPVVAEAIAYLVFAVPMILFVLWPAGRRLPFGRKAATVVTGALLLLVGLAGCGSDSDDSADAAVGGAPTVNAQITDAGCLPASLRLPAGKTNFKITASGSGKVTEYEILQGSKIVAEKEDITPGLSASFSVDLKPGTYTIYCPHADRERGPLVVSG